MTATVRGCLWHDSILKCPPDVVCHWPTCVGQIPALEPGLKWGRDEKGWRGEPTRQPKTGQ